MANSKYEYVKSFEQSRTLLPNTYIVVRIDGRGFHFISAKYGFEKPNDQRALELMNAAAAAVMNELPDITLAYGISDEFRKIVTTIVSTFTSYYTHLWASYFPGKPLSSPMPSFDGRAVQYPSAKNLRDYVSWRQVDCHINNLYNTTFWALRKHGSTAIQAEEELKATMASDKHEILFSRFKINYNDEPEIFKKGSVLYREYKSIKFDDSSSLTRSQKEKQCIPGSKAGLIIQHIDVIKDGFWEERPWILL